MVEKKEEDNQQEEIKEPDSENIDNDEDNNDSQENTDSEETSEEENSEENNLEKEIEVISSKAVGNKCPVCWKIFEKKCARHNCGFDGKKK